ncbi:MAG: hypothetical protein QM687_08135 [Ferruginibacter sp.]
MKAFNYLLVFIFVFAVGSCKKNTDSESNCHIIVVTPSSGDPVNFYYNSDDKFETIKAGGDIASFAYNDDSVIVTQIKNNTFYQKRRYKINGNGLPLNLRTEYDITGNSWANMLYEYNGTELIKLTITTSSSGASLINRYYWNSGNLDSITDGTNTLSYEYYTDEAYRIGDAHYLVTMNPGDGMQTIHTSNMLKSEKHISPAGSYTLNYNYVFDSEGKVTTVDENGTTYGLQYQCR